MGHFIFSHDFTLSTKHGSPIECGTHNTAPRFGYQRHFASFPIEVNPNDPFYSKFRVRCLNPIQIRFVQGYSKQADPVTHFRDASTVYVNGSIEDVVAAPRTFQQA